MAAISIPGHEVLHLVGEGGMAQVWAGARMGAGQSLKPVAIKMIRPDYAADGRYREMFLAEGRTTMMFSHGNLVAVFDVGVVGEQLYIVMDWVDGVTFAEFEQKIVFQHNAPLELPVIVGMIIQLLCGLNYAHNYRINRNKVGIVHRDVSPYNVMVTSSGEVKLMDFGVARIAGGQTTRSLKGNLVYMPREQAQGDPRVESDLYAVGGILHGLLEGRRFREHCRTEDELMREIWDGTVPRLRRRGVPQGLDTLRRELLAPDWKHRPHSAAEVIKRLAALPIQRHASVLPMQELYRTSFGDGHSGLTRFAHRDPKVWVEHMRKLGRAKGGHRLVGRRSSSAPVRSAAKAESGGSSAPAQTIVRPRAHEAVGVHPAGRARHVLVDASFDHTKTTPFRPGSRPPARPRSAPSPGPRPSEGSSQTSQGDTLRLSWSLSVPGVDPGPTQTTERTAVPDDVCPTVRLPIRGRPSDEPETASSAVRGALSARRGWRARPAWAWCAGRWRELALGPVGVLVAAAVALAIGLPLACGVGQASTHQGPR